MIQVVYYMKTEMLWNAYANILSLKNIVASKLVVFIIINVLVKTQKDITKDFIFAQIILNI